MNQQDLSFSNKVVIITGAAAGIGKATAYLFSESAARVVIADINEKTGQKTACQLKDLQREVFFQKVDIGQEQSIISMVQKVIEKWGRIDVLVNCACAFIMKGVEATFEEWMDILRINVAGTALCVKHVVPHMKRNGGGQIVNIASMSALIAEPNFLTYSTTKGALLSMTRGMALDLAPFGIRVNALSPGMVWTESNAKITKQKKGYNRAQANAAQEMGGAHLLNRVADPHEIASVIRFLASDQSSFITGSNVVADGGYTVR